VTPGRPGLVALLSALVALAIQPCLSLAHEFWIAPSTYVAQDGDTVRVSAFSGMGFRGEARRYAPGRVVRFVALAGGTTDLAGAGVEGDTVFAAIVPPDAGGLLVAYESTAAAIELPGAEFDAYLVEDGLDAPLAMRRAARGGGDVQRERYARCAKTWVAGPARDRASAVAGLTLELVPLRDPGPGSWLPLRVLFRGRPLAGALVRAWRQPLDPGPPARGRASRDSVGIAMEARSDAQGVVRLQLAEAGEWLLSCVHMLRSDDPAKSDWQSWWASLTFARPVAPRPPR
jgi:uncharacterized GH25 family protein